MAFCGIYLIYNAILFKQRVSFLGFSIARRRHNTERMEYLKMIVFILMIILVCDRCFKNTSAIFIKPNLCAGNWNRNYPTLNGIPLYVYQSNNKRPLFITFIVCDKLGVNSYDSSHSWYCDSWETQCHQEYKYLQGISIFSKKYNS